MRIENCCKWDNTATKTVNKGLIFAAKEMFLNWPKRSHKTGFNCLRGHDNASKSISAMKKVGHLNHLVLFNVGGL